jgi:sugar O-acyltransferase (sialic acid O-acetyltransferase NeuD family)
MNELPSHDTTQTVGAVDLLVVGASGHACVVAEAIGPQYRLMGFVDEKSDGSLVAAYGPLFGKLDMVGPWLAAHENGAVHVAIGDNDSRRRVVAGLLEVHGSIRFATVIHARAWVSPQSVIGAGSMICAGAIVGAGAVVGEHCILNTLSSLDHHGCMGEFASLAPAAATGGRVSIGAGSAIGMGAMIHQNIAIGKDTVIGSQSLVSHDLPDRVVAFGIPCRVRRSRGLCERYL